MVGKTVNFERARTDPVRTYVDLGSADPINKAF